MLEHLRSAPRPLPSHTLVCLNVSSAMSLIILSVYFSSWFDVLLIFILLNYSRVSYLFVLFCCTTLLFKLVINAAGSVEH